MSRQSDVRDIIKARIDIVAHAAELVGMEKLNADLAMQKSTVDLVRARQAFREHRRDCDRAIRKYLMVKP